MSGDGGFRVLRFRCNADTTRLTLDNGPAVGYVLVMRPRRIPLLCMSALALATAGCGLARPVAESDGRGAIPNERATAPYPLTIGVTPSSSAAEPAAETPLVVDVDPVDEQIIRGWNEAINGDDNEAAAAFFVEGATIEQSGKKFTIASKDIAVRWLSGFSCGARITSMEGSNGSVIVQLTLEERPNHTCGAPGVPAAVEFVLNDSKIHVWRQVAVAIPGSDVAPETPTTSSEDTLPAA